MTDYINITPQILGILLLIMIWSTIWKAIALWRSAWRKRVVWFIAFLIMNTLGLLEIFYLGLFSKIKDAKSFRRIHDGWLMLFVVIFVISLIFDSSFLFIVALLLAIVFSVSLIQKSADRREWAWLVLGILIIPIIPIIYYFANIRKETDAFPIKVETITRRSKKRPAKKKTVRKKPAKKKPVKKTTRKKKK